MTPKPMVFFHVMKCGGTSVREALAVASTGQRTGPRVVELDGRAALRVTGYDNGANQEFRSRFLAYALLTMDPAVVLGHFRYRDWHEEHLSTAHFVTILRDPVERLVSLYRYRRWKVGVDLPVDTSFAAFLESEVAAIEGHRYVGTFCGSDDVDLRSKQAVELALGNLRRFGAVGLLEDLDGFGRAVSRLLDRDVTFRQRNASPSPEAGTNDDLPAADLDRAHALCQPDRRLYAALRRDLTLA